MRIATLGFLLLLAFPLVGCPSSSGPRPSETPVAWVGDRAVTRAALDDYFEVNLFAGEDPGGAAIAPPDVVKSRLLDDLLQEVLLAAAAEEAGIAVAEDEIDAWVAGGPPDGEDDGDDEPRRRRFARREILAHKLLQAEARAASEVSDAEIETFLAGAAGTGDPAFLREEARRHLAAQKSELAVESLVARLRARAETRVVAEALPFAYVPAPK